VAKFHVLSNYEPFEISGSSLQSKKVQVLGMPSLPACACIDLPGTFGYRFGFITDSPFVVLEAFSSLLSSWFYLFPLSIGSFCLNFGLVRPIFMGTVILFVGLGFWPCVGITPKNYT